MDEEKKYYLPIFECRGISNLSTAISDIINKISRREKLDIYEDIENAWEFANSPLHDDDIRNVVEITFKYHRVRMCCEVFNESLSFSYFGDFKKDWCNIIEKRPPSNIVTEIVEDVKDNLYKGHVVLETKKRKIKQPALKSLNECADITDGDCESDDTFAHDDEV